MALGFMSVITALLLLATGLIGEMLMRIYFESTGARTYRVRRLVGLGQSPDIPPDTSTGTVREPDDAHDTSDDKASPQRTIMT